MLTPVCDRAKLLQHIGKLLGQRLSQTPRRTAIVEADKRVVLAFEAEAQCGSLVNSQQLVIQAIRQR